MRKKLESSKVVEQKGRSLVELLGVLAMAGVLSVAGLYGFGYAMEKWRENETLDRYAKVVAGARTSRILEDENEGYRTKYDVENNHALRSTFERQHVDIKKVISNVGDDDDYADDDRPLGYLIAPQKGPYNRYNQPTDGTNWSDYEAKEVEIWVDVRTPSAFSVHASNLTMNACKRIVQSNLGHNWGYNSEDDDIMDEDALDNWFTAPELHDEGIADELCQAIVESNGAKDLVLWFGDVECIGGATCPKPPRPVCNSGNDAPECDATNPCADGEYCSNGCCYSDDEPETTTPGGDDCPTGTTQCVGTVGTDCCEADEWCDNGVCKGVCPSGNSVPECSSDSECGEDERCSDGCCVSNNYTKCDGKSICETDVECPADQYCSSEGCCELICGEGATFCSDDSQCSWGEYCNESCCSPICEGGAKFCDEDANCGSGYVCEENCCKKSDCELCTADSDCDETELCINGCCTLKKCTPPVCSVNEDCEEGQVCNGGCCEGMILFDNQCKKEGLATCETAKDCAEGEMCDDNCCTKMEGLCPSGMTCETDDECVVSEKTALENGWKTQGKCDTVNKCCKMVDCDKPDPCVESGGMRMMGGTCCPKGRGWTNCGDCVRGPTYIDECGIERDYAKACCDTVSDAPDGCTGVGYYLGQSFGQNYPKCYTNYPVGTQCCKTACAAEDGSKGGVCCDGPDDVPTDYLCCNLNTASTLHCCMSGTVNQERINSGIFQSNNPNSPNDPTQWAAGKLGVNRGNSGKCCGLEAGTKAQAYVLYKKGGILATGATCVNIGEAFHASTKKVKPYKTDFPKPGGGGSITYKSGFVCKETGSSGKPEEPYLSDNGEPDCCDGTISKTKKEKKDGYDVGTCCPAPQEVAIAKKEGSKDICCVPNQKASQSTSANKDGRCCENWEEPYGDAECCDTTTGIVFTQPDGTTGCCPQGQLAKSTNGSGDLCCETNKTGTTKGDGSAVCCPTGQVWDDQAGQCVHKCLPYCRARKQS